MVDLKNLLSFTSQAKNISYPQKNLKCKKGDRLLFFRPLFLNLFFPFSIYLLPVNEKRGLSPFFGGVERNGGRSKDDSKGMRPFQVYSIKITGTTWQRIFLIQDFSLVFWLGVLIKNL